MRKPDTIAGLVHVGLDVLTSTVSDKTKKILLQVGNVIKSTVDGNAVEQWQQVGLATRPPRPAAGKASAQVCVIRTSDRDIAFAGQDLRGLDLYGQLDHGESCLYAAGEDGAAQGRVLIKKDGGVAIYTRVGNKPDGAGMIIQVDPTNDAIRITNGAGYGIIIDKSGCKVFTGGDKAGLVVGADGACSLIGTGKCQVDGSTIILGSTGVPGVNNVCVGPAGIAAQASQKVFCAIA